MQGWQRHGVLAQYETVLVVDDGEVDRQEARQVLEAVGYRVLEAEGGVDALWVLMGRDARVDLVLIDCTIRDMDGWELVRIIGAILPALPTIIMTGWAMAPAKEFPASPTAVLEKPFTPATLTESVRNVLAARGRM